MRDKNKLAVGGALAALVLAGSAHAAGYDKASAVPLGSAMTTQCKLGNAALSEGSTPTAITGVTIVTAQQAKCLIDQYANSLLVIGAMDDMTQLPDAYPLPILGYDKTDDAFAKRVAAEFTPLTGGNTARPILIYCHHASCQFSANGAEHLVAMGYTRVYWLRDGTKGWRAAGYPFANQPRFAPGVPQAYAYFKQSGGYTYGCFGEENLEACGMKMGLAYKAYTVGDLKPAEKPVVLDDLLNTVAVYAGYLRTGGRDGKQPKDAKKGLELVGEGLTLMRKAQASGEHPDVVRNNLKLQQEAALAYLEAGRPADAQAALADARGVADKAYAGIEAVRSDDKKRREVVAVMTSAEKLERAVSERTSAQAIALYGQGKTAEAAAYRAVATPAYARGEQWIGRLRKEGLVGFMEQEPPQRLGTLKLDEGKLLLAAGDKPGAARAYQGATFAVCGYVTDATIAQMKAKQPISDIYQYNLLRTCQDAEFGRMKASGELDKLVAKQTDAMLRQQYDALGLDYDKIRKKSAQ